MPSARAIPDSNPTRAQLRLVVLGQWVRAGLDLARGAQAGRGLVGGAVALWRVFQAIRLAIQLAQRLSELRSAPSFLAPETEPGATQAQGLAPCSDDPSAAVACLRQALSEIHRSICDALGLAPDGRARPDGDRAMYAATKPAVPRARGRLTPPRGLPPDRPPGHERAAWRPPLAQVASAARP